MAPLPDPSCDFQLLHHSGAGYVARCNRCRCLHVAFGTTVLAFGDAGFHSHLRAVREACTASHPGDGLHQKCVRLPTGSPLVQLALTNDELASYHNLLAAAATALQNAVLFRFSPN